ncbi:MAG: alkaline phosphatase D family protein [Pyrinomonadaceae bacterium]|nr:alkaline phosphatase D family protein [Pyrinomonadaceae bacterium]
MHDEDRQIQLLNPTHRREFLRRGGALLGLFFTAHQSERATWAAPRFSTDPFSLGVASGDPLPTSVVLWTRLAPDALNRGGMPPEKVLVQWQVASDDKLRRIVKQGTVVATPDLAHSVHVDVRGRQPARPYWYRFKVGAAVSPIGRTQTAPALGSPVDNLRFAFASCQHYEQGFFTPYRHMAREDLDLVVHLGDYIYEGGITDGRARRHNGPEIQTLTDYRNRYALYKSDPDLQLAHASFPWIVTWDDHEVDNNYGAALAEDEEAPAAFLKRRAAAYQAYYEHMPLRAASMPKGPDMQLYRRLTYGSLAEFTVLDTRQYRTDQPCGDGNKQRCAQALDERATLTGPAQERWLLKGLDQSRSRWNVLAQQVMMAEVDREPGVERKFAMDQWAGYVAARNRLLGFMLRRRPSNPVVLTGDIHSNWVADLKADFDNPRSATVGTEFVGTSISSGGDGTDTRPETAKVLAENPHVKFFNAQRGYVRCHLTPRRWQSDYRVVDAVTRPGGEISTRASFIVEDGKPGAHQA